MLKTVNGAPTALKTPGSVVDFAVDWRAWLAPGEAITASAWTCEPTLPITGPAEAGGLAVAFLGGGVEGQTYRLTNAITTNGGRQDSRTIVIRCTAARA
jgi:hypothetical protein